ncbi:hypothetical protein DAH66_21680 [Sphingomonas koreensis]|uniref:Uncharacterized protein n=1 Tax=Sphingomonas koreensis TaxID=93064 RepID=A0A430FXF8_9SPHN|nr:hypothetical protein [Sphingomonas koreensis]RSY76379.1 hypothetical protein DAH66_21680 [Sphingomonas koreensis]
MRYASTALQMVGQCLFAAGLALVLFLVVLSDGKVLNPIHMAGSSAALLVITVICWAMLVAFGWLLTVGKWRRHRSMKRAVLMSLLMIAPLVAIFSLLPDTAPRWIGAAFSGLVAMFASIVADRFIPSERD